MAFTLTVNPTTDVWPPLPTLDDKINEWIDKVDYITSSRIQQGFDVPVKGVVYHFSFRLSDQTNFLMMMTKATSEVMTTFGTQLKAAQAAMAGAASSPAVAATPEEEAANSSETDDADSGESTPETNESSETVTSPTDGEQGVTTDPTEDAGTVTEEPVADPVFCTWQGHKDGVAHTLPFTLMEFIAFAMDIGNRKQALLAEGWTTKDQLRAVKTEQELVDLAEYLQIDLKYRDAQDALKALGADI